MTKIDLNEDEWSLIADAIEIAIGDIPDDVREGHPEDKRFWKNLQYVAFTRAKKNLYMVE